MNLEAVINRYHKANSQIFKYFGCPQHSYCNIEYLPNKYWECKYGTLYWSSQADEPEFVFPVFNKGIYPQEDYTMVMIDSPMGGDPTCMIFSNKNEINFEYE